VLVADEHPIFRKGLRSLLEAEPGFVVVGEAGNGEEAVRFVRALQPDVLLLDLKVSGLSRMDTLAALSAERLRTIVLTASIERPEIVKALQLGAAGVMLKTAPPELVFKSIRSVMEGQHWIARDAVSDLVRALRQYAGTPDMVQRAGFGLSPRELEITAAITAGLSNKEIARKLRLSVNTVKHHLTRILDKVGASNRVELALFALHHGLVDEAPAVDAVALDYNGAARRHAAKPRRPARS